MATDKTSSETFNTVKRVRKSFAKITSPIATPNLVDIQKKSFEQFLQADGFDGREDVGLQAVFKSIFPVSDFNNTCSLEFESYSVEKPKYDVDECRLRGMTYAAPIKITVRLVVWEMDDQTKAKSIRDVKEQEVYMGEIPLMTETGAFIINGTERVVVSQLHRSPGVFFDHDNGTTHASGKLLFNARVIPYRGSWLDFEFDHKDFLYCRIDRRRKFPATIVLKALGYTTEELLNYFYDVEDITLDSSGNFARKVNPETLKGQRAAQDLVDPKSGDILLKKSRKFTRAVLQKLEDLKIEAISIAEDELIGKVITEDVLHPQTSEVILEVNQELTDEALQTLKDAGVDSIKIAFIDGVNIGSYLRDTLIVDKVESQEEALIEIFKRMRPGDPPTLESSQNYFNDLFFNEARYDLSNVGRLKINHKFGFSDVDMSFSVLRKEDIMATVKHMIDLKNGKGNTDDIDHLGNRRVRSVGELLENQYRIGLVRMERAIKERMSLQDIETQMPHDLINAKPVTAIIKEFFGSSQLSQFMEQTNPLAEITHKRRLSALGPGGLTRERAGFEVRDVHTTHYGRICPIETPEGPNIGLISSLATFAKVNDFGFVETPYRRVENAVVTDKVDYFSALEEEGHTIAQANVELDGNNKIANEFTEARRNGEPGLVRADEVDLADVSPNQLVSVAASLVPFLENDDANRALMGSNMQRQAVPLMISRAPLVGTGVERIVAKDSGVTVVAKTDGTVESVDSARIVVRTEGKRRGGSEVDIYNLVKYRRSNQNTCVNQRPIVKVGDKVREGEVIADGPSTELGELALGQNVLVAFMPWGGYNFEDSILISERLLKDDVYTSIHIEEFECVARDTKLGKEEITRDIPNCGEEALRNLDATGIIRIGAEVTPGDIMVGKITPKGESQLSPEEKLLRAIFGEKAGDVRDTSLRVPPGVYGTVINAHIFSREGIDKDERYQQIVRDEEERLLRDQAIEITIIRQATLKKVSDLLVNKKTVGKLLSEDGEMDLLDEGQTILSDDIEMLPFNLLRHIPVEEKTEDELIRIMDSVEEQMDLVRITFNERIGKLKKGDELPPGVIKMVKVSCAIKRKLSVGDKMAGRHGNKGVISRIMPVEDMPFMADGRAVDIVLNPLGVPSRMNVGQILEVHLGWAAQGLGDRINEMLEKYDPEAVRTFLKGVHTGDDHSKYLDKASADEIKRIAQTYKRGMPMASAVFDRADEQDIRNMLELAKLPTTGQTILFDGRTGEAFDHEVTVGIMYVLKLHHLVEDKIHARSIGPYSLVTQQPLGGKAQFGGQRLGEMEVWALEAYGAAYGLQEMLTVKSDDVAGRTRMYEAIVKGENILEPGMPESFNVLMQELKALALNVELLEGPPAE
ncbi:DNA-directed RNA polymerase subunit beta [bacterium]|nr:DNA-directed RNA polymerase subunit beta [bacterium]